MAEPGLDTATRLSAAITSIEQRKDYQQASTTIEELILQSIKDFSATQDSFALNVAGRSIPQLETVLEPTYDAQTCIIFLRVLRGVCLLHRPSRQLFNDSNLLQTLLNKGIKNSNPDIQVASIDALVAALVRQVEVIRLFESINGPKIVCDVFKQSRTTTKVKLAILQFLFFYLVPETKYPNAQRKPPRLTTQDKQAISGKYLSNVDGLVRELEMNKPFGSDPIEW